MSMGAGLLDVAVALTFPIEASAIIYFCISFFPTFLTLSIWILSVDESGHFLCVYLSSINFTYQYQRNKT